MVSKDDILSKQTNENKISFANLDLKATYTFGSPRIGNNIFVDEYNNLLKDNGSGNFRFVLHNDPIPHGPCYQDYAHAGTAVYSDHNESIVNPTFKNFNPYYCAYDLEGISKIIHSPLETVNDHRMSNYFKILNQYYSN